MCETYIFWYSALYGFQKGIKDFLELFFRRDIIVQIWVNNQNFEIHQGWQLCPSRKQKFINLTRLQPSWSKWTRPPCAVSDLMQWSAVRVAHYARFASQRQYNRGEGEKAPGWWIHGHTRVTPYIPSFRFFFPKKIYFGTLYYKAKTEIQIAFCLCCQFLLWQSFAWVYRLSNFQGT